MDDATILDNAIITLLLLLLACLQLINHFMAFYPGFTNISCYQKNDLTLS